MDNRYETLHFYYDRSYQIDRKLLFPLNQIFHNVTLAWYGSIVEIIMQRTKAT